MTATEGNRSGKELNRVLGRVIAQGLRNYFPGLDIFLESLALIKYGKSLEELVSEDVLEFCRLLDEHFSSRETASRVLRMVLKPIIKGPQLDEVLEELFRGNTVPLLNCLDSLIKEQSKKGSHRI